MNERAEKFRQQLQKELGLTVGPKDPILAEWLAHEEFREETARGRPRRRGRAHGHRTAVEARQSGACDGAK